MAEWDAVQQVCAMVRKWHEADEAQMNEIPSSDFLKNNQPKEKHVQRACLDYLKMHPAVIFIRRFNSGATKTERGGYIKLGEKGDSDLIGMLANGRFLAIEIKAGKNKPTKEQEEFIDMVNDSGGVAFVAWGTDDIDNEFRTRNLDPP